MIIVQGRRLRECQFRTQDQLWSCWCYKDEDIAPMFKYAPTNVLKPTGW